MTEWIVSASVLIAVMAVLRRVLKGKLNPRLQYALWAIVLARLLIPVSLFNSSLSVQNVRDEVMDRPEVRQVYSAVSAPIPVENYDRVYREVVREYEAKGVDVAEMEASDVQTEVYSRMDTISVQEVLTIVWIAGMAVMTLWLIGCNAQFALRLRRSRTVLDVAFSPIPVYITDMVETPCLFGLFRPTIYLTQEAAEDEQVKRYVLIHEITHYQQFDHIWAILRAVCLVLHWCNPLVWLAFRLSRQDGEMACDEGTLMILGEEHRGNYGRTLIALATQTRLRGSLVTATTMADGKKAIKERIVILMKNPKTAFVTMIALILVCTLVVGCTFTGSIQGEIKENGDGTEPVETTEPLGWQHPLHAEFLADGFEYVQGEPEEVTYFIDDQYVTETNYAAVYYRYAGTSPVIELASLDMTLTLPEEWLDQVYVIQYTNGNTGTALIVSRSIMEAHQGNAKEETDQLYGMEDYLVLLDSMVRRDSYSGDWDPRSEPGYIGENETHLFFVRTCDTQDTAQGMWRTKLMLKIGQKTYESLLGDLAQLPGQIMNMITIHGSDAAGSFEAYDALFQFDGSVSEWRAMATMCVFDDPSQIDPSIIFYNGFDGEKDWSSLPEEAQAYLEEQFGGIHTSIFTYSAERMEKALQQTFGISLTEIQIPEDWVYYEATDSYYDQHGDVLIPRFTITGVEESGDMLYVYYTHDADSPAVAYGRHVYGLRMRMTLRLVDGEYRVLANQVTDDERNDEVYLTLYENLLKYSKSRNWMNIALGCEFAVPEDVDLEMFFYPGIETPRYWEYLNQNEERFLAELDLGGGFFAIMSVSQIEEIVQSTFGLSLDDFTCGIPESWHYFQETDSYYVHYDTQGSEMYQYTIEALTIEGVELLDGKLVRVYYTPNDSSSYLNGQLMALTLRDTGDGGYTAVSNQKVVSEDQAYTTLTLEQLDQVHTAFDDILYRDDDEKTTVNPLNNFFSCYYNSPAEIDLRDFVWYFCYQSIKTSEEDFNLLAEKYPELEKWRNSYNLSRYPADVVDEVMYENTGYHLEDLYGTRDLSTVYYLEETDSYYSFASDAGWSWFDCVGGRIYDGYVELYSQDAVLTLREENGRYYIYSHLPKEAP